jgi:hypothetical protein
MAPPSVIVDPRCKLSYQTYVLRGLMDAGRRIRFRRLDCPRSSGAAMVVDDTRVWVHTDDNADDTPAAPMAWADVVARVNVAPGSHDVVALGPLFGLRIWPLPRGYATVLDLVAGGAAPRKALQYVRFQGIARVGIDEYTPAASDAGYVFGRSRNWVGPHGGVREPRLRFAEALRGLPLEADVAIDDERMPLGEYLERTRRSAVVFSNPAAHRCLGWKLGEFLALGKAIITLPVHGELPAPLRHGEHVHVVEDDVDAMREAIGRITGDDDYRRRLETGARAWYEANMAPLRVGQRLLAAAGAR